MGIKHFFIWFRKNFPSCLSKLKDKERVKVHIDNLMLDLNGILHNSSQKIFKYGNFAEPKRLLRTSKKDEKTYDKLIENVYEDICKSIEELINVVNPKKRLLLMIDGPAPLSKICQQRQRRFRSSLDSENKDSTKSLQFDSCSISPGTKFMTDLAKYLEKYIKDRLYESRKWKKLEIIFSDSNQNGEGEHKLVNYIRQYGKKGESYCINGLDADLFMLGLSTHCKKFYLIREDLYDHSNKYFIINIGKYHRKLEDKLRWDSDKYKFNSIYSIKDFVFLSFFAGNDFLPHVPSIEILGNGIDLMITIYKSIGKQYGHLTEKIKGRITFRTKPLEIFLSTISDYEKINYEKKLASKVSYFPNELLNKCSTQNKNTFSVNIHKYREEYFKEHFRGLDKELVSHQFFDGLDWVLKYYNQGVPSWNWFYQYQYVPSAFILSKHIKTYRLKTYNISIGLNPIEQLLSILPPKSYKLLPSSLQKYMLEESILTPYLPKPEEIIIDSTGVRRLWEAVVIIPFIDIDLVQKIVFTESFFFSEDEKKRLIRSKTKLFRYKSNRVFCYKDIISV